MKLNVGCGPVQPVGWVNVDSDGDRWANDSGGHSPAGRFERGDPLTGLPFGDDTVDGAVAHHVLQMVAWPDLVPWLTELRRVLHPGGYLRLSVPDLSLVRLWLRPQGYEPLPPIADHHEASTAGKVCLWVSQAGATRSVFTGPWLVELCLRAGFAEAREAYGRSRGPAWITDLDVVPDRRLESAYVDAVK